MDPSNLVMQFSNLSPAKTTIVYDTLWRFAVERQKIFYRRLNRATPPWTKDEILNTYKFTNAYRACDRVSQYLIRKVIYEGDNSPTEVLFRIFIFKTFNKIETWEALEKEIGQISYKEYTYNCYNRILIKLLDNSQSIYSGAYIMAPGRHAFGKLRKHQNHLKLIEMMMSDGLAESICKAKTMSSVFKLLLNYPTIGYFLAYQYAIDINYSELTDFSEMEFVVPGPGAIDGISKCFRSTGGLNQADVIRMVTERQLVEFERLGLNFRNLFGRPLQLIDVQNLFCEISKYSRIAHPEINGHSGRTRIKQKFSANENSIEFWFPPKWKLNKKIRKG